MSKKRDGKRSEKARTLFTRACSAALAADVVAGRPAYPSNLMPLSDRKTFNADPTTRDNYNPTGDRGEQRYTPRHNVREEDMIDGLRPGEAERASEGWTSSGGTVVDAGAILRDARRLNR